MIFTNKVNYSRSNFYADFFQLNDADDEESKIWKRQVAIQEADLHTVGQHLGGLSFTVPMYDRSQPHTPEQTDSPVGCYLQLVKTNKTNTVQVYQLHSHWSRSSRYWPLIGRTVCSILWLMYGKNLHSGSSVALTFSLVRRGQTGCSLLTNLEEQ